MKAGEVDGHGRYAVLDEDEDGLLCHECGARHTHLGLHVYRAHGLTADEYRERHGLKRKGLVSQHIRDVMADNARDNAHTRPAFTAGRDPAKATAARLAKKGVHSPAGIEAMRAAAHARRGRKRLGIVITCQWCGAQFCPLDHARRRRYCTRSCASRARSQTAGGRGV